jgi:hypothetical protein
MRMENIYLPPHVMWIKDGASLFITVSEAETFE